MFLLVLAYPGCPGQTAVKWLLMLLVTQNLSASGHVANICQEWVKYFSVYYHRRTMRKWNVSPTYIGSHGIIVTSTCKGTTKLCNLASGLVNCDNVTKFYTQLKTFYCNIKLQTIKKKNKNVVTIIWSKYNRI